ncbi:MAG: hypothetical protein KBF98_08460 [Rhodoferax sp.]|nr:hypothetical protein [Rhodoferax sp.]
MTAEVIALSKPRTMCKRGERVIPTEAERQLILALRTLPATRQRLHAAIIADEARRHLNSA